MTRKDFQLIADVIASFGDHPHHKLGIAQRFANALSRTNARFDRERFLTACGIASEDGHDPATRASS